MYLNYVGLKEKDGHYHIPNIGLDSFDVSDDNIIEYGVMWGLLSRFRFMCLLSNITDDTGRPIIADINNPRKYYDTLLELGSDLGHSWTCFKPYVKEVYGVEVSEHANIGKDLGNNIFHGDICCTCYENNFFDIVVSAHVLEHAYNIDKVMAEIYRITKPGGWSAHVLPCTADNVPEGAHTGGIHQIFLGYKDWLEYFSDYGFDIVTSYFGWATNQEDYSIIARKRS